MTQILPVATTYYNVVQYGADPTGVNDSTTFIQNAINAAAASPGGGGTIFFPAGTYLISNTISLAPNCRYVGAHYHTSYIKQKNGANIANALLASQGWINNATLTDQPIMIEDLGIDGNLANNGSSTAVGILLMNWSSLIRSCSISNTPSDGIQIIDKNSAGTLITNTQPENRIIDCKFATVGGNGIHITDFTAGTTTANTDGFIRNCIIQAPTLRGIWLERSAGWLIEGNHVFTSGADGINCGNGYGTRIAENYVEAGFGMTANGGGTTFQAGITLTVLTGYGAIVENNFIAFGKPDPANGNTWHHLRIQSAGTAYCKVHGNMINGLSSSSHFGLRVQVSSGTMNLAEGMNTILGFAAGKDYSIATTALLDERFTGDVVGAQHIRSVGSAPTIAAGANNGTSPPTPTISANSNDLSGQLNFGTGTTPTAGAQTTVTFATAFSVAPHVILTPVNSASTAAYYVTSTTGGFTVNFVNAPTGGQGATTFAYFYHVLV